MKKIIMIALMAAFPLTAKAAGVTGYWLTQNERSVIEVEQCDQGLCGNIHWIIAGGMQFDNQNPDDSLRDRSMCGLPILWGFDQQNKTEWANGKIYKADDGDIYNANMTLVDDNRLRVRGYVGIPLFGKTQMWKRVSADDYPKCD